MRRPLAYKLSVFNNQGRKILWKKMSVVLEKIEDPQENGGRLKILITKDVNAELVEIEDLKGRGGNLLKLDGSDKR